MSSSLYDVYERLADLFGAQHWWPGETEFAIIVGAVLTQNTAWTNIEKAIENLRDANALTFAAMNALSTDELSELIRPAGYYRLKAKRLTNLFRFIDEEYAGSVDDMLSNGMSTLREQLLGVNGIGPETADSIILYAAKQPTFVVDAYTARLTKRHEWLEEEAD